MKKIAAGLALICALSACTDAVEADRAARAYGFSDVKITGYRMFGCSEKDDQRTGFTARNIKGEPVSGVVCSNWSPFGKTSTVRID